MVELPVTKQPVAARVIDARSNVLQLASRQDETTLPEVSRTCELIETIAARVQSRAA